MAVSASRGSILLLDRMDGRLEVRAVHGYHGGGPRVGARFAVDDKVPVSGGDGPGARQGIRLILDPDRQTVFVPMVAKERLIGGIELDLQGRPARFSANDQKVLYALASQAAMFIENARLERDVRSMFLNIIVSMAGAVDAKDAYTHGHSLRVARVALLVAQQMGLARERMEPLLLSAILHDVGKIAIPDKVLKKPSRLSREEFDLMKSHPVVGAKMLSHIPALEEVIPGIRHHHEYWDGSGYPDRLRGEEIPLAGRIILIGDAFDAMTTDRVYRKGMPVSGALAEMTKFVGSQFDPSCVALLQEAADRGMVPEEISRTTPTLSELIDQIR
jgi:putative nucleotidyltransferase with HDIG domain